ncbi:MAG: Nitrogen regulatory protein P-II [Smithella sp. PtaU1.Bin162]|nr:MAG: Nitrogen regulatory protein P-II [Smithella sp. PtaU1.Bin162]
MLKKIEAIIREDKVNDVQNALNEIGIVGLNMFEVRGHGRQGGVQLVGRAGTYQVNMLPKIQINIVLNDRNLDIAIEAILKSAYTGEPGDGIIFVTPVEDVIRVRTRERGQEAMMYPGDIDMRKSQTVNKNR